MRRYVLNSNEPVRIGLLVLGVLVGASTFLLAWGNGVDWRIALGGALGQVIVAVFGGEAISSQTYGPDTIERLRERIVNVTDPLALYEVPKNERLDEDPDKDHQPADLGDVPEGSEVEFFGSDEFDKEDDA
jgi:hypothetical protein